MTFIKNNLIFIYKKQDWFDQSYFLYMNKVGHFIFVHDVIYIFLIEEKIKIIKIRLYMLLC